jgi:bla regulator protein BlaR1
MITSIFINALGQAIFESVGQALLIYVALQVAAQLFPSMTSKYKYDVNYLGLTIICCWFIGNLIKLYSHNLAMASYASQFYGVRAVNAVKSAPTFLQQAEAIITHYAKYIAGLYMIGLLLHAIKLMGGFVHIHQIRKQKNLQTDFEWTAKAEHFCEELKIVKKVSLFFSTQVQIPLTIGYLKPIIIFPISLISNLDHDQVEAILMHELAHIKRHDYLLNILQCIMETILCFNPFVWLISKTIRQEREYCCDDMVVGADFNNFTYSRALLIIAQQNSYNYALAMASAGNKKYPLLNRIKRLNMETKNSLPKFNLLVIVTIAAIAGLLAWGIPQYSAAKPLIKKERKLSFTLKRLNITVNNLMLHNTARHKKSVTLYADTATGKILNDSTKKKFRIVIQDDKGNRKEYNSLNQMPDSDRQTFLQNNQSFDVVKLGGMGRDSVRFASMEKFKMSPEFKKQMRDVKIQGEKIRKEFNSPEWKKQQKEIQDQGKQIQAYFNSPEWKKQQEDIKDQSKKIQDYFNSPDWKKQQEDIKDQGEKMQAYFNSPEWKKQQENLAAIGNKTQAYFNSPAWKKQQAEINAEAEKTKAYFNSPEWKKQQEDIKMESEKTTAYFNSPEWKKQQKDIKIESKKTTAYFNSPQWKKQQEDIKKMSKKVSKQFNSPEWKKQMEDMQKNIKDQVDRNIEKASSDSVKSAN